MSSDRRYCMCCGEDVPVTEIDREGRAELTCAYCGFTLATLEAPAHPGPIAEPSPGTPASGLVDGPRTTVSCIVAVDAADDCRSTVRSLLEHSGLADEVVALNGGADLVSTVAQRFAEGLPVDLVILEAEMPVVNGFAAAGFLRSLEAKLHRQPCPLIFFTRRKADETLRQMMAPLRPAWYCAKGDERDPADFERRATRLIGYVTDVLARRSARP